MTDLRRPEFFPPVSVRFLLIRVLEDSILSFVKVSDNFFYIPQVPFKAGLIRCLFPNLVYDKATGNTTSLDDITIGMMTSG
jgi:hypothetical protein